LLREKEDLGNNIKKKRGFEMSKVEVGMVNQIIDCLENHAFYLAREGIIELRKHLNGSIPKVDNFLGKAFIQAGRAESYRNDPAYKKTIEGLMETAIYNCQKARMLLK
jgi:hypothetical protein